MSKKMRNVSSQPGGPLIPTDLVSDSSGEQNDSDSVVEKSDKKNEKSERKVKRSRLRSVAADVSGGRRSFIKTAVATGIGAVALGAPLCGGARMVLAPVTQHGNDGGKFYPIVAVDALTKVPAIFDIVDDRRDAWIVSPKQQLGSVYLRKVGDEIFAFNTICPHAACQILYGKVKLPKSDEAEELFYCPCHAAHFTTDGKRLDQVSPRDMDALEVKVEDGTVCVRYENFVVGVVEKKAMA